MAWWSELKCAEVSRQRAVDHLNSFPKTESHYCRQSTSKIYIHDTTNLGKLSITRMRNLYKQQLFKENNPDITVVGYIYYFNLFHKLNFAIHKPKKDQCSYCVKYKENAEWVEKHKLLQNGVKELHVNLKRKAQQDSSLFCFNFDLEAILYTLFGNVSTLSKCKFNTYNFTIYDLATCDGYCYMWNQTLAKRGSNELVSLIYDLVKQKTENCPEVRHVIFFSDKCGGEGLNQFTATMCLHVIQMFPIESIDHIFMVSGHSHMEVDSMHAAIERWVDQLEIHVPYEWEVVACLARKDKKPYNVTHLEQETVFDWKAVNKEMQVNNVTQDSNGDKVYWKSNVDTTGITWLRYEKKSPHTIYYKHDTYSQTEPFKKIETVKHANKSKYKIPAMDEIPHAYSSPIPVQRKKYNDLMKLCEELVIPRRFHNFYAGLCVANDDEDDEVEDETEIAQIEEVNIFEDKE